MSTCGCVPGTHPSGETTHDREESQGQGHARDRPGLACQSDHRQASMTKKRQPGKPSIHTGVRRATLKRWQSRGLRWTHQRSMTGGVLCKKRRRSDGDGRPLLIKAGSSWPRGVAPVRLMSSCRCRHGDSPWASHDCTPITPACIHGICVGRPLPSASRTPKRSSARLAPGAPASSGERGRRAVSRNQS
jgi:hypothetical protein